MVVRSLLRRASPKICSHGSALSCVVKAGSISELWHLDAIENLRI